MAAAPVEVKKAAPEPVPEDPVELARQARVDRAMQVEKDYNINAEICVKLDLASKKSWSDLTPEGQTELLGSYGKRMAKAYQEEVKAGSDLGARVTGQLGGQAELKGEALQVALVDVTSVQDEQDLMAGLLARQEEAATALQGMLGDDDDSESSSSSGSSSDNEEEE